MNNEEKSRTVSRARINLFDVAIILLVLFTVLAIWQKNNLMEIFEKDRTKSAYAVAFEITPVRYDLVSDIAAGTVLYVQTEEDTVELGLMLDEPVITPREGSLSDNGAVVDLVGTLSCHGVLREGALWVDRDVCVTVDSVIAVATEIGNMQIRVISITEIR